MPGTQPNLWPILLIVCVLTFGPTHSALADDLPSVEQIVIQHEATRDSWRTGRIEYEFTRWESPATLESRKERQRESKRRQVQELRDAGAPAKLVERAQTEVEQAGQGAALRFYKRQGTRTVRFVFDTARDARISRTTDQRDLDSLRERQNLGRDADLNLSKTFVRSLVGDKELRYESAPNRATFSVNDSYRLAAEKVLDLGLITRRHIKDSSQWSLRDDPHDPMLVVLEGRMDGVVHKMWLDREFGFRVVRTRTAKEGSVIFKSEAEYDLWGNHIFPKSCVRRWLDAEGDVTKSIAYRFSSVAFNIGVDPKEFEVDIPADAAIYNLDTRQMLRQAPQLTRMQQETSVEVEELAQRALDVGLDDHLEERDEAARRRPAVRGASRTAKVGAAEKPPTEASPSAEDASRIPWVVISIAAASALCLIGIYALVRRRTNGNPL